MRNDKQPRNPVIMYLFCACLCASLPSKVTSTSLVSAACPLVVAGYDLVPSLRFLMTPDKFKWPRFKLGLFAKYCYAAAGHPGWDFTFFPVTAETVILTSLPKPDFFPRGYWI